MSDYPHPPPFGGGFGAAYGTSAPTMHLTSANLPGLDQYAYQPLQPTSHSTAGSYDNQFTNVEPFSSNQTIFSHFQPASRPVLASPKLTQSIQKPLMNISSTNLSIDTGKTQATSSALNGPTKSTMAEENAGQAPPMEMSDLEDGELGEDDTGKDLSRPLQRDPV